MFAGGADDAGEDRVAVETGGLVQFAGIDVRFAGVAGAVDDEFRSVLLKPGGQHWQLRVVGFGAGQRVIRQSRFGQIRPKRRADVASSTKQENHLNATIIHKHQSEQV